MKGRRQVRLDICLPLLARRLIIHCCIVLPVRIRNATVIDEDVDAVTEELCSLLGDFSDLRNRAEIAQCVGEVAVGEEGMKVSFRGML